MKIRQIFRHFVHYKTESQVKSNFLPDFFFFVIFEDKLPKEYILYSRIFLKLCKLTRYPRYAIILKAKRKETESMSQFENTSFETSLDFVFSIIIEIS